MAATVPLTEPLISGELCELSITFDQMQIFAVPLGARVIAVAGAGRADGPRLRGDVLPGGGDWLLFGSDGVARLDVRATIRTDDEEMVHMTALGRVHLTDDARDRFLAGDTVTQEQMFARTTPLFEAGAGAYDWLNATVSIGVVSELSRRHIRYRIYTVA